MQVTKTQITNSRNWSQSTLWLDAKSPRTFELKAKWQSMVMKYNNKQHSKQLAQLYCHSAYISNNENINKYKNLPVWRTIRALCSLMCKNNATWPGWKYEFTKPNIALISQINDMYFTLCVGCRSSHCYAQKCLTKPTTLLTRTQKQTNITSSSNITQTRYKPRHVSLRAHISI